MKYIVWIFAIIGAIWMAVHAIRAISYISLLRGRLPKKKYGYFTDLGLRDQRRDRRDLKNLQKQ